MRRNLKRHNHSQRNILYLNEVRKKLSACHVLSPHIEAENLVRHFGKVNRLDFFTGEKIIPIGAKKKIEQALRWRVRGMPLAYHVKRADFFGRTFFVTKDTLIPRPETELLVEETLKVLSRQYRGASSPELLDIGTGCGAIAVCLTLERPDCRMTALDVSRKALKIAHKNIESYELQAKIKLVQSDLFDSFGKEKKDFWDVMVSNPPYVAKEDFLGLSREVKSEPRRALDGGPKGLRVIHSILGKAPYFLKKGGWLLMEIGKGQSEILRKEIAAQNVFSHLRFVKDFAGIDRIFIAQKN